MRTEEEPVMITGFATSVMHSTAEDAPVVQFNLGNPDALYIVKSNEHSPREGDLVVLRALGKCPCYRSDCTLGGWEVVTNG